MFITRSRSSGAYSVAQGSSRIFPETGKTVKGTFLDYWGSHGGLLQYGYPISDEISEQSPIDGQTYTVQYFERAMFELHGATTASPQVLLGLLGVLDYQQKYPSGAAGQQPNYQPGSLLFPETKARLGGIFLRYWQEHGGLSQQGYPISDEFQEKSEIDGRLYLVQYFERAVFEYHPENAGTADEVLLSQLGTYRYNEKYPGSTTVSPTALAIPTPTVGRIQGYPQGSSAFLVWNETSVDPGTGSLLDDSGDILAIDLASGKVSTVTNEPCTQDGAAISDAIVVWQTVATPCASGNQDILARDLRTGTSYSVASGPNYQRSPAIFGTTVVWLEDNNSSTNILSKDLVTGSVTEIRRLDTTPSSSAVVLYDPQISGQYIVWAELGQADPDTRLMPVDLQAYNRNTKLTQIIAHFDLRMTARPEYSLDEHMLVWYDQALHYTGLQTKESTIVNTPDVLSLVVKGKYIIWSAQPEFTGFNLYGIDLNRDKKQVVTLVSDDGNQNWAYNDLVDTGFDSKYLCSNVSGVA